MWGGGESWGLEKKKARTHLVTFPGSCPWAKVHTATPSWLAQGPTAPTPKGHRGWQLPPRSEVSNQATLFTAPHSWGKSPLRGGTQQPPTGTVLLCPSCSTLGAHQL